MRRLARRPDRIAFTVGLNGLITSWDGKDDDGKPLPPGKYAARGYAVGQLKVEGEAILGNDWAQQDETLRVRGVEAIAGVPEDEGLTAVFNVGPESWIVARFKGTDGSLRLAETVSDLSGCSQGGSVARPPPYNLEVASTALVVTTAQGSRTEYRLADGESRALPKATSAARNGRSSLGRR